MKLVFIGFALVVLGVVLFLRGAFRFNLGIMALGTCIVILAIGFFLAAIVSSM